MHPLNRTARLSNSNDDSNNNKLRKTKKLAKNARKSNCNETNFIFRSKITCCPNKWFRMRENNGFEWASEWLLSEFKFQIHESRIKNEKKKKTERVQKHDQKPGEKKMPWKLELQLHIAFMAINNQEKLTEFRLFWFLSFHSSKIGFVS